MLDIATSILLSARGREAKELPRIDGSSAASTVVALRSAQTCCTCDFAGRWVDRRQTMTAKPRVRARYVLITATPFAISRGGCISSSILRSHRISRSFSDSEFLPSLGVSCLSLSYRSWASAMLEIDLRRIARKIAFPRESCSRASFFSLCPSVPGPERKIPCARLDRWKAF